jgi:hypothetical protein
MTLQGWRQHQLYVLGVRSDKAAKSVSCAVQVQVCGGHTIVNILPTAAGNILLQDFRSWLLLNPYFCLM